MLRKFKTLIMAVMMAMVSPVFRMAGTNNNPPAPPDTSPGAAPGGPIGTQAGTPAPQNPVTPDARIRELEGLLASQTRELDQAGTRIAELEKTAAEAAARIGQLDGHLKKTVGSYKAVILTANPDILPDMLSGETVEEIDAAVTKATDLINKIKTNLQSQVKSSRMPAGAPQRGAAYTSGLSSREKINAGLGGLKHN